jgi:hypothetical protein
MSSPLALQRSIMTVVYLGPPIRSEAQSGSPLLVEVTGASTSTSSVRASRAGDRAKARRCLSHFARVMNADLGFAPERLGAVDVRVRARTPMSTTSSPRCFWAM